MPAFYDQYDYRRFWQNRDYENHADRHALRTLLTRQEGPRKLLLDVGGGFGRNAKIYSPLWSKAVILDPSQKNLSQAKDFLKDEKNVSLVLGSAEKLPFPSSYFDTLICVRVFHHLPDPEETIKEFSRVLMPGGSLILEVANKVHAKAKLQAFFDGRWDSLNSLKPVDRRSQEMIKRKSISFVNHHPEFVRSLLNKYGFTIAETLSVSNFRSPLCNIPIVFHLLLLLEKLLQKPLAHFWFGPSIYFLANKT